ncbi:hypothetical protein N7463_007840 [Penicillium fimorum]|uniref:Uncharacterized protein n=1 Tax=Penicillium fimorum TaxID=1882269 RepID=A0A9X0C7Z5_9EURO|nr:hypothetical protein N7463_007840 [Penicillium fimorum]
MPSTPEPIAVVGSSCRFPGSCDTPSKLWELLQHPRDLLRKIPEERFNIKGFYHPDPIHHGTTNVQSSYFLDEDPGKFDANFFAIPPKEAESIDPQQRILMETVYDALCSAGLPMEQLRGSSTAVYVGLMCDDWATMVQTDIDEIPTYTGTGTARSIMSNRLSYFFDWHGPSMTIDTACSSSLIAVHEAVRVLRSGESSVAIAAGANLILSPEQYVAESNLRMLSPTGRCQMWDSSADGYGRGEGVASVVLKTLSQALKDGDHIECIIRETGVNQDGRTSGITVPSSAAQTSLIRATYSRAGLDLSNPMDRPQFFHAHGTGTKAGDPKEAEAIYQAFFSEQSTHDRLYVGSIKTVIGHTEGTAGLASLIGTSLALQNATIPPNMHFKSLNRDILPFYSSLEVPVRATQWPAVVGQIRRASINSFGFGGTNAHAIVEEYIPAMHKASKPKSKLCTPFVFSANSAASLKTLLTEQLEYLQTRPTVSLRDLVFTLQQRRSTLSYRKSISSLTVEALSQKIDELLSNSDAKLDSRYFHVSKPRILAVFTGQGAQWPRMGAALLERSQFVRKLVADLDESLASLPESDRPQWTIGDQLLAAGSSSRVAEAAISQPLCTAIQVILVNLLQAAGIQLNVVVGHSSGEIGAAYAAGLISSHDAIRIAYYRGVHAKLAASPNGAKGAMAAVGTSPEDAEEFCQREDLHGRVQVAAYNSSSSLTLSGDEEAIDKAIELFKGEQKFARRLKVDTAYHSAHMEPCAEPYLESLQRCSVKNLEPTEQKPRWLSSVWKGTTMSATNISNKYWVSNMVQPVLFSSAVMAALENGDDFDIAIEIGPHAALKGPASDNLAEAGVQLPYTGVLSRGKDDVEELSTALGFLWTHLGAESVKFDNFDQVFNADNDRPAVLADLPSYPFNHQHTHWAESRVSRAHRQLTVAPHPVLGMPCVGTTTSSEAQWKNILRPSEISWLQGHKLQGQMVFPATGYVVMALEAMKALVGESQIAHVRITNMVLERAIVFDDDNASIETLFSINISESDASQISADFTCFSTPQGDRSMAANIKGHIEVRLGRSSVDILPVCSHSKYYNLVDVDIDRFYSALRKIGYEYSEPFRGMASIKRRMGFAHGTLIDQAASGWEDQLLLHPGMLDTALQTLFAAFSYPGDESLRALHVPVQIDSLEFNPHFRLSGLEKQITVPWETTVRYEEAASIKADLQLFTQTGEHTFLQIEGISLKPFTPARPEDDATLFSKFEYLPAGPDGELAALGERLNDDELRMAKDMERLSFYYLRRVSEMSAVDRSNALPHHQHLINWTDYIVDKVARGDHPCVERECISDTHEQILELANRYPDRVDALLIQSTGQNLPKVIREKDSILQYMTKDDLLGRFYKEGLGLQAANWWLANMAKQISHRYPRMKILEIGAGTGGSTQAILPKLGSAFSTYTYTDVSSGFFEEAEEKFKEYSNRMIFKTFDMQRAPADQGLVEGTYDMVLASNVLHVADPLENMMSNVRRLLKPGGFLVNLETVTNEILRNGIIMGGLPGWWIAANSGRPHGPMLNLDHWDSLLKKCQFGGIETSTPIYDQLHAVAVWAAQAVDSRLELLRNPTTSLPESFATDSPPLILIGGKSLATYQLVEEVSTALSSKFSSFVRLPSIESLNTVTIPDGATVLGLSELDEPLMREVTDEKIEALKALWRSARNILWVSKGARAEQPYSYMMFGIGRVVKFEQPNINLQLLDLDLLDKETSSVITDMVLKHQLIDDYSRQGGVDDLLWSSEPEVFIENKQILIPRLYLSSMQNLRANSSSRAIYEQVDPARADVKLVGSGGSFQLEEVSPLRLPQLRSTGGAPVMIRIRQSLLQFVKLGSIGSFMLCTGTKENDPNSAVIALTRVSESPTPVEPTCLVDIPSSLEFERMALLSVAAQLVARRIVSLTPRAGTVLIHEASNLIKTAVSQEAAKARVNVAFTTCSRQPGEESIWIHRALPARLIKEKLPRGTSVFVNLAAPDGSDTQVTQTMKACVPDDCMILNAASFFADKLYTRPEAESSESGDVFQAAWKSVMENSLPIGSQNSILLSDIQGHNSTKEALQIVDWAVLSIPVRLRPVDHEAIFRSDRTYLLIGLAGEVGQSICQWMAQHGAGCIVLTSRNPKVDPEFIRSVEECGSSVRVLSLDITSRDSFHRCLQEINRSMPEIGGVANGALIVDDMRFDEMTLHSMNRVLRPKVEGSKLLDDVFHDKPLEFFIMFSSLTACLGNSGQSNYAAANMFMTALAFQRRKRGVAASIIDLSALMGIGHVGRSDTFDAEYFASLGATSVSESDLHHIFAEAVKVGRADSVENLEIVTGLSPVYVGELTKDQYRNDLKFSHLTFERLNTQEGSSSTSTISVRAQLKEIKTLDQAVDIMQGAFTTRVKKLLQIPSDEVVEQDSALVELGVDSLIAIDVRSWFMKELDVDFPVLKILGGATIAGLINDSIEKIPTAIIDISQLSAEGGAKPAVSVVPRETKINAPTRKTDDSKVDPSLFSGNMSTEGTASPSNESDNIQSSTDGTSIENDWREIDTKFSTEVTERMSFGQTRFWFLHHALQDKTTFNVALSIRLSGPIQIEKLSKALERVGERHEAMRTRYFWSGEHEDVPSQGILSTSLVRLEKRRISDKLEAQKALDEMRDHTWDLSDWKSMRFVLLSLSDTEHWLIVGSHHITLDGISIQVIFADLEKAYLGMTLLALPEKSQYRSIASQQHQDHEMGRFQKSIDFYKKIIPRDVRPIDLFSFAKMQVRQPQTTYRTSRADIRLHPEDTTLIKQFARQSHSTNFHLYTAVLQVLLFRLLPNIDELFIGLADANRTSQEVMETVGFFLNLLPIRLDRTSANSKFSTVVKTVRNKVYGVLEHSALPFDVLLNELGINRSANAPPIFQVFVDYRQGTQERAKFADCKAQGEQWYHPRTGYDISLDILENADGDTLLSLQLQQSLYTAEHTELLLKAYVNLLKSFTKQPGVDVSVNAAQVWASEDVSKALQAGTGPSISLQWPKTVVQRVDDMIRLQGSKPALRDGRGKTLTFEEMGRRIDSIAEALSNTRISKGSVVGVLQEPGVDWICSMLAIFRVGATYLPLDLRNSIHRVTSAVKTAQPTAFLIDETTVETVGMVKAAEETVIDVSQVTTSSKAAGRMPDLASPDSIALILFTSGTTSEPKGILIKHSNLVAQNEGFSQQLDVENGAVSMVLQQSAFSFDFSLEQTFVALCNGGCLLVASPEQRGDPSEITRLMSEERVTYTSGTPSEYEMWFRFAKENLQSCSQWQYAFFGGEPFSDHLVQDFRQLGVSSLRIFNNYGPGEATIACTSRGEIPYRDTEIGYPLPAGFAAPNYAIYIVDDQLQPLPIGVPGEIIIGGAGVSAGYLGLDDVTRQNFLPSPFAQTNSKFVSNNWLNMYRTGDRGFLRGDGALFLAGRMDGDTQVKLRGFRIELGEIENSLIKASDGVLTHAVVTLREEKKDKFLVAHVVFSIDNVQIEQQEFLDKLQATLPVPDYMRPSLMIPLDELPLTSHSKVNRAAIQTLSLDNTSIVHQTSLDRELTDSELKLESLWRSVLPVSDLRSIGPSTSFFHVGGSSLLLVKLQRLIKNEFTAAPKLNELMNAGRLLDMASVIETTLSSRIDWDAEIAIPDAWTNKFSSTAAHEPRPEQEGLRVLLTGATGYLGRHLLPSLIESDKVSKIFCLVRLGNDLHDVAASSEKISVFAGDLAVSDLGLSQTEFEYLAAETDVILHFAANRSFWDDYEVLRSVNLLAVKEVARLALHRRVPLHFLSSGAVCIYEDQAALRLYEKSVSNDTRLALMPPDDGSDGYVASKWAADRFLRNVAEQFQLPVTLHRPVPVPGFGPDPSLAVPETDEMVNQLVEVVRNLGIRPAMNELAGWADIIPMHFAVQNICAAIFEQNEKSQLRIVDHPAERRINWGRFIEALTTDAKLSGLPSMPTLLWIGEAKKAGFSYFMPSHRLIVVSDSGDMVSRR